MSPAAVPRLVTVWCPDWAAVAAGVGVDVPAAVLFANRVVARTPLAAAAGVRRGQRRREAQRACPELTLIDHDPARDARQFEPVIRAVADLAPRLDVIEPGWLCLAARGPSRYFGGDQALAERMTALVAGTIGPQLPGALVGVGVADGRAVSAIAARRAVRSGPVVVPPGGASDYVAPLPVSWLSEVGDVSHELVDLFARLGLTSLGDLAALPAADVLGRFGPEGLHAWRLAGGCDERPPVVSDPPPERRCERSFDDPVEQVEPLVFVAKQLADEVATTLGDEGRVCTRLVVTVETEHGERCERSWYRDGGMTAAAMVERVRWQLDGWLGRVGGPSAGVVLLRLTADEVRGDDGHQLGLWGGRSQADHDAARAVARLTGIAGEHGVRVPVWCGGRLPADRYRWVPTTGIELDDRAARLAVAGEGPWPGAAPPPSPTVVFDEPVEVQLTDPDGRPVEVSGRGEVSAAPATVTIGGGAPRRIEACSAPWPVDQRWWDARRQRRVARLQVVTDDGAAFLVVAEHRQWWIAAAYE